MKINIYKGDFKIPTIVRQSFKFKSNGYQFHTAEVCLSDEGGYSILIDGNVYSSYKASAYRSPLYKEAIEKVTYVMQQAVENCNIAYTNLSKKTPRLKRRSTVENQLNKLTLKQYEREKFSLPMPRKSEVELDLQEEANHKFFSVWSGNSSKKRVFVSDTLEGEYNERMANWEELKQYHETIQSCKETQANAEFLKEYNECKKAIEDELYGNEAFVNQQLFEVNSKLNFQIPFDITLDIDYNKSAYVGRNSVSSIGQNQSLTSLLN